MRIRLGRNFDGEDGVLDVDALDSVTTGPLGMLGILETQLGLPHRECPNVERVVAYRECLKQCDHPDRFYHDSFDADDLETSRTLLNWRDQWYLHGWQGTFPGECPSRLSDMQDVEAVASLRVPLSEGQRIARIAKKMKERTPRVSDVELCDPIESFPHAWQKVLSALPTRMQLIQQSSQAGTMLSCLQSALSSSEQAFPDKSRLRWIADGSVVVVRSETTVCAGHWLGALLTEKPEDTLVVAAAPGCLAETFAVFDQPTPNLQELSVFRPALQLLPLVVSQVWEPMDVSGLIKFLTHPLCPIPSNASIRLAETVSSYPGTGGHAWQETLDALQKRWEERGDDWEEVREKIAFWVEHIRYSVSEEVPLQVVVDRAKAVADHFRVRLKHTSAHLHSAFGAAYGQAQTFYEALRILIKQGETHIGACRLQVLLEQCTSRGTSNPLQIAEAGACRKVTTPSAVVDSAQRVVWWQFQAPEMPKPYPWSPRELNTLKAAGIFLPDLTEELCREAEGWQKPILTARNQLILVLPPSGTEAHPLWLMMDALFEDGHKPVINELEERFNSFRPGTGAISHRSLPAPKRWWDLPKEVCIPRRQTESFSSLEAFLFNPYQWVLRYHARLTPGRLVVPDNSFLLFGNLSHSLVERFYLQPDALGMSVQDLKVWFPAAFENLVATEGATLRMPGRKSELKKFQDELLGAMTTLHGQLQMAQVIGVQPEVQLAGTFSGGKLTGYADLLVTRRDGRKAIIDMKWAGGKKYPEKLAANRHLQLALYGELIRQQHGVWPDLSYFIISRGQLIAPDQSFFPNAQQITQDKHVMGEGVTELWSRFLVTWKWRREQLDAGCMEVAVDNNGEMAAPEDGMTLEILNQRYNDYLALAGWEEN